MLTYRDKFVAHLDSKKTMFPPRLDNAIGSTAYLRDYLLEHEEEKNALVTCCGNLPPTSMHGFSKRERQFTAKSRTNVFFHYPVRPAIKDGIRIETVAVGGLWKPA